MIDFELTDEQKQLKETCRRFAEKEIKPVAAGFDAIVDPRESFPLELIGKGCELGFHTLLVPEAYGGMGGGLVDFSIMMEELAVGDAGVAFSYAATCAISRMIAANGTPEQCERWLAPFCADKSGEFALGFGGTEPSGGTEIFYPEGDPRFGTKTTAVKKNGSYVINGSKQFTTNAGQAKLYGCLARTDKDAPNFTSNSIFFLPSDTPGFSIGKIEDKMGHRASSNGALVFDNVELSPDDLLGEEGKGVEILLQTYHANGVGMGSLALGIARAAYEMAVEYAKERNIWGQPIIRYQAIGNKLVDMKMAIETGRLLIQRIAWASDQGKHGDDVNPSMAKVYASEVARKVTVDAMQVLGGYGYMKDYPAEKLVRDAMVTPIYDGANEVLRYFMSLEL
ncbi:MAG: acyl-CoA dehydrogenase family protein [Gammaproteobacteria bacterium]|nr:acyl-CoA dehydrogenase family protein [Gammaproteobacteria bacterium]